MSESITPLPPASKRSERKVVAATWASFLVSLAGLTVLNSTVSDMVPSLPDWMEAPAYALVLAATTWLAGYNARTTPTNLSPSTRDAVEKWLRGRLDGRAR